MVKLSGASPMKKNHIDPTDPTEVEKIKKRLRSGEDLTEAERKAMLDKLAKAYKKETGKDAFEKKNTPK